MNQKAKIIKPKKKFGWANIINYLRCLWSNRIAADFGLNKKWYIAVIVAIISVVISIIPVTVTAATSKGSSFLNTTYVYNYDEGFYSFLEDAKSKGYDITFDQKNATCALNGYVTESSNDYLLYKHEIIKNDGSNFIDFQVYFVDTTPLSDEFVNSLLSEISTKKINSVDGRDASYIIFTTKSFITRIYKPTSYTAAGGIYGDYANLSTNHAKLTDLLVNKSSSTRLENISATLTNYKELLDEIYISTRTTVTLNQTWMIAAVNAGIVLLFGLVVFLLTRGKNNPNRGIKFQQCYNITYWCATSPALLSLILGFMFSNFQVMLFVMLFGFRIMWLGMRTLSVNNAPLVK